MANNIFEVNPTGGDDTVLFKEVIDDAAAENAVVAISPGAAVIASTLLYKVPMFGQAGTKGGITEIRSAITDGSAVIKADNFGGVQLRGFGINGQDNDCKGIELANQSSRGFLRDIRVANCTRGFDLHGWINNVENCHAINNTIGVRVLEGNSVSLDVNCEHNGTAVLWAGGSGGRIRGTFEKNTVCGIDIQNTQCLHVDGYFEDNGGKHIHIGSNPALVSRHVTIRGYYTDGHQVVIDNVEDFNLGDPIRVRDIDVVTL